MVIRSQGLKTDIFLNEYSGEIIYLDDITIVRNPHFPEYYWGNYLIFDHAPAIKDVAIWTEKFDELFASADGIEHRSLTWDTIGCIRNLDEPISEEVVKAFEAAGYSYSQMMFLELVELSKPAFVNKDIVIRTIQTEEEWEQMFELQVLCWGKDFETDSFRVFKKKQCERWRSFVQDGYGLWFGAFLQGRLVGDAGVFWNDTLARYQNVEVHPDFRKQGICGTLVYTMAKWVIKNIVDRKLIISAEVGESPERIYRSLGFAPIERNQEFWMSTEKENV